MLHHATTAVGRCCRVTDLTHRDVIQGGCSRGKIIMSQLKRVLCDLSFELSMQVHRSQEIPSKLIGEYISHFWHQ